MFKNRLSEIINEEIENFDYRGEHTAPSPLNDSYPMHDLNDAFPDIYTKGFKFYGYNDRDNIEAIQLIIQAKDKPNMSVKIYRAVPNVNHEIEKEIKIHYDVIKTYNKFKHFPVNNQIVNTIGDKYNSNNEYVGKRYNELQKIIYDEIWDIINDLKSKMQKFEISNGDWVTIVKNYANIHGTSNLNNKYKILTKTVRARDLYTESNSVLEWGYYKS